MSLRTRVASLEQRMGGRRCPGCGWTTTGGPITFSIRTHDEEDDDGPTHCQVCGRRLGFTMALGDEEALAHDAMR